MDRTAVAKELVRIASLLVADDDKIQLSEIQPTGGGTMKGTPAFLARYNSKLMDVAGQPNIFTFRRGYFYRQGINGEIFAKACSDLLERKGFVGELIDRGDHWAAFSGGAKEFSSKTSFFWATFRVSRKA